MSTPKKQAPPPQHLTLWRGGHGRIQFFAVASNEEDAIKEICKHDPVLAAIGCTAAPVTMEGYDIVAVAAADILD